LGLENHLYHFEKEARIEDRYKRIRKGNPERKKR